VRPALDLAAAFLPAAERVSGDFHLVAAGPGEATVLVVGDVVGHGLAAARRAAFVRTIFVAVAPFSDDPAQLLSWVNTALVERAGTSYDFVTAACITFVPAQRRMRWRMPAIRPRCSSTTATSSRPAGRARRWGCTATRAASRARVASCRARASCSTPTA